MKFNDDPENMPRYPLPLASDPEGLPDKTESARAQRIEELYRFINYFSMPFFKETQADVKSAYKGAGKSIGDQMILAIDFDNVIHNPRDVVPPHKMGRPLTGAVDAMRRLRNDGHIIIIHSARPPERAKVIADWLAHFEIPYDSIWTSPGKPVADFYLDDKAVRFHNWLILDPDPALWHQRTIP